jgi:hypothetical protein
MFKAALIAEGLAKQFDSLMAVDDLSLTGQAGEIVGAAKPQIRPRTNSRSFAFNVRHWPGASPAI